MISYALKNHYLKKNKKHLVSNVEMDGEREGRLEAQKN